MWQLLSCMSPSTCLFDSDHDYIAFQCSQHLPDTLYKHTVSQVGPDIVLYKYASHSRLEGPCSLSLLHGCVCVWVCVDVNIIHTHMMYDECACSCIITSTPSNNISFTVHVSRLNDIRVVCHSNSQVSIMSWCKQCIHVCASCVCHLHNQIILHDRVLQKHCMMRPCAWTHVNGPIPNIWAKHHLLDLDMYNAMSVSVMCCSTAYMLGHNYGCNKHVDMHAAHLCLIYMVVCVW
jgi:hypothetical protein